MSLLTMIGNVMNSMGFPRPAVVMSSTDQMVLELLALANTSGNDLVQAYPWQEITRQALFTSTAAYSQGTIDSTIVTDGDFNRMVDNTLWNRSAILKATGPVTSAEWQADQAFAAASPYPKFRLWQGQLWIGPSVPKAGDTWAFEYVSENWCQGAAGTAQPAWAADTDTGILDENLMRQDIIWRWKSSKSLEYADDLASFTDNFNLRTGQSTGARSLFLGGANTFFPINVPEGNWTTS